MRRVRYRLSGYCGAQSGFTLLELMISIVLLGLLVLVVSGAMRLGYRSLEKGERKTEVLERLTVSCTIIDAQIQSAIPVNVAAAGENPYVLRGTRDSVRFASSYSLLGGQKGYVVVSYRVDTDTNNRHALYAQENVRGIGNGKEIKLLEGFDDIRFEYCLGKKADGREEWTEEWLYDMKFPLKIRVHLLRGDRIISMIVPIRAQRAQA
ncbi:MAG: general secretion pathway protein J [Syntrophorhabdus sp. PtaU1.Bin058]|nr:MAG: general secretion pathway protein J [Syntrophorhabdus sp. PtaU1.Bin058]